MIPDLMKWGALHRGELVFPASTGNVDIARAFLDAGADPDALFEGQLRPLHGAAGMRYTDDNTEMVELLLEAGADPNALNAQGETALDIAGARLAQTEDSNRRAGFEAVIALLEEA